MSYEPNDKKRRLFIAIEIENNLKKDLVSFQKKFETKGIKWTKPENLHITVQFLGWVDESKISNIEKDIERVAQANTPFDLSFENIIFAPPRKTKRMIWAVFNCDGQFENLVKKVSLALKKYISKNLTKKDENVLRKHRTPHITLARFKNPSSIESIKLDDLDIRKDKFKVNGISLWESKLSREGAKYQILNRFNFK